MRRSLALLFPAAISALGCSPQTLDAGSNAVPLPAPSTRATFGALVDAVTMDDANLYFACEDGWIYSLAKDGTSAPAQVAMAAVPGSNFTDGLAVDDENVYWTAQGSSASGGAIVRAPKSGGSPETLTTGRIRPWGIAVDDENVYWAEQGLATSPAQSNDGNIGDAGSIMALAKAGGAGPTALARELSTPDFVAVDGDGVVWHDASLIGRVPKAGGASTTLFSTPSPNKASNLVVTGGTAYWGLDDGSWSIASVPTSGGSVSMLASGIAQPTGVAVLGSSVYWSLAGGDQVGAIEAVPAAGGAASAVSPPDVQIGVLDQEAVFLLADDQAFYSVEVWQTSGVTVAVRVQPR
jgi:hypothetical protein